MGKGLTQVFTSELIEDMMACNKFAGKFPVSCPDVS